MEKIKVNRKSFVFQLMAAFVVVSILPVLLIGFFSYYNTSAIVKDNISRLTQYNLNQTKTSLDANIGAYEDVIYQIYSDDEIIECINKINKEEDLAVSKNQLRRELRGVFYVKEYIRSITVITENGTLVFYDSVTGSSTENSWIYTYGMSKEKLYEDISSSKGFTLLPARRAKESVNAENYLFHIGHRIVDYNRRNTQTAVVIMSVDEKLLEEVCIGNFEGKESYNFITDAEGNIVSYPEKSAVGQQLPADSMDFAGSCEQFIKSNGRFTKEKVLISYIRDEETGWTIINAAGEKETLRRLETQQSLMLCVLSVSVILLAVIIRVLVRNLTQSVKHVVHAMQDAAEGKTETRVKIDPRMPYEMEKIALQYNSTLEKLLDSVEKEQKLERQKRNAEITALEAQINPHFLYNMLDTINWIAIGKKEFEISRSITALAAILRYGINNSNGIVTLREECEWLKQYLYLQQTRLKGRFESRICISPEAMEIRIHKLLFQPFVENAVIHGFEGIRRKAVLEVSADLRKEGLYIEIYDNGKGMSPEITEQINRGTIPDSSEKNHIGIKNAVGRIKMYYGENASIKTESQEGEYTKIMIIIPHVEGIKDENSCC